MSENMGKEPPQEVVPPISSIPNCPVLRKDDRDVSEAWLIGNLLQDLTPKKGSQLLTNENVLHYFVFSIVDPCSKIKGMML